MKTLLTIICMCTAFTTHATTERLTYAVKFGFLSAGQAEITFTTQEDTYAYSALAWTNSPLFNLKERILIEGDKATFTPSVFTMNQIENDYRANKSLTLKGDTALYQKEGGAPESFNAHGAVRDYMSALFRLRYNKTPLQVGSTITENVVGLNGAYTLELRVLSKQKIYTKPLKWQEVYEIQPVLIKLPPNEGIHKNWRIYISADEKRLPLKIKTKLKFGAFTVTLTDIGDENAPRQAPKNLQDGSVFAK